MNEFKDQLDATEKEKVTKLVGELRELAVKGQAADPSIDAEKIKEKIGETQQASLGLFQKVGDLLPDSGSRGLNMCYYRFMRSVTRRTAQKRSLLHRKILRRLRTRRRKTKHLAMPFWRSIISLPPSLARTASRHKRISTCIFLDLYSISPLQK